MCARMGLSLIVNSVSMVWLAIVKVKIYEVYADLCFYGVVCCIFFMLFIIELGVDFLHP